MVLVKERKLKCYFLSLVWLFVTLWSVTCQVLLSMGFSRQELKGVAIWRWLPFPSPGDLLKLGLKILEKSSFFFYIYIYIHWCMNIFCHKTFCFCPHFFVRVRYAWLPCLLSLFNPTIIINYSLRYLIFTIYLTSLVLLFHMYQPCLQSMHKLLRYKYIIYHYSCSVYHSVHSVLGNCRYE